MLNSTSDFFILLYIPLIPLNSILNPDYAIAASTLANKASDSL